MLKQLNKWKYWPNDSYYHFLSHFDLRVKFAGLKPDFWLLNIRALSHWLVCLARSSRRRWTACWTGWNRPTTPSKRTGSVGRSAWELTSKQPYWWPPRGTSSTTRRWAQSSRLDKSNPKYDRTGKKGGKFELKAHFGVFHAAQRSFGLLICSNS